MDWCGSFKPKTPKYQPINKEPINESIGGNILASNCEAFIPEATPWVYLPSRTIKLML
jgi:hypothetical protein